MIESTLSQTLRRIERRLLAVGALAAIGWGTAIFLDVLIAAAWLDLLFDLPSTARAAAFWLAFAAGAAFAGVAIFRRFESCRPADVARVVDRVGSTGGLILSGFELERTLAVEGVGAPANGSRLTSALARVAAARAAERAATVSLSDAAPLRPAGTGWAVAGGSLLFVGLVALVAPGLVGTQWARFWAPYADTPPYSGVRFEIEPGDAMVRYGDPLDIYIETSGSPVDGLTLVLTDGEGEETLTMFQEPDGRWRCPLARVTTPGEYYVRSESARSVRHTIGVITLPEILGVQAEVVPPDYAQGKGQFAGELPPQGVSGLAGTRVRIRARSNRPLDGGTLSVETPGTSTTLDLTTDPARPDEAEGEFSIAGDGAFEIRVRDVNGEFSRDGVRASVVRLRDERPFVRLLSPQKVSLATPNVALPVSLAAEDDYGISRLQLYRSLNDSRPLPLDTPIESPPPRRKQESLRLPLDTYGLEPGDQIKLFARVEDNDPEGAKGSESPVAVVHIIAQEEFERMIRAREGMNVLLSKYRQAMRMLESAASDNEKLQERLDQASEEEARQAMQELADKLRQDAATLAKAAQNELPYDADENLREKLAELAKKLEEAAQRLEAESKNPNFDRERAKQELKALAEQLGQNREKFDQEAMKPLEQLEKAMPLMADQSRFQQLVQNQRDLAERLQALRDRNGEDDPEIKRRMRDLQEQQNALKTELDSLLDEIEEHALALPEEEAFEQLRATALDFVEKVRASDADKEMALAESGLEEFSGSQGSEHASLAADILESFLSQCQGMGQCASQSLAFNPGFGQCLGNTPSQLLSEMGFNEGSGTGQGAGSGPGSSSRRGNSEMGLYGGLPGLASMESLTGRRDGADASGAAAGGSRTGDADADRATIAELLSAEEEGGAGGPDVPLQYRRRVGDYFRKLSEGLEGN